MSDKTKTAEEILQSHLSCRCGDYFKSRKITDTECPLCPNQEQIIDAMNEFATKKDKVIQILKDELGQTMDLIIQVNSQNNELKAKNEKLEGDLMSLEGYDDNGEIVVLWKDIEAILSHKKGGGKDGE